MSRPGELLLCLALIGPACAEPASAASASSQIHVLAASSLAEMVSGLAEGWRDRGGGAARVRWAATSTLARQIQEGVPAQLFLAADPAWVDALPQGMVLARKPWLGNRLVLVTRRGERPRELDALESLVLGGPSVPVGRYGRAAWAELGLELPERVVNGAHARDVLAKLCAGAAPAAIVYQTDAALGGPDAVEVWRVLPDPARGPVVYEAALLDERARPLYDALTSEWVLEIARGHGFEVLP
jgi:molybdate transport system substrate-binding protein